MLQDKSETSVNLQASLVGELAQACIQRLEAQILGYQTRKEELIEQEQLGHTARFLFWSYWVSDVDSNEIDMERMALNTWIKHCKSKLSRVQTLHSMASLSADGQVRVCLEDFEMLRPTAH